MMGMIMGCRPLMDTHLRNFVESGPAWQISVSDDGPLVGFTVAATEYQLITPGTRPNYNNVISNEGAGYMTPEREFLCPESGWYLFTFTSVSQAAHRSELGLFKDSVQIVNTIAADRDHYDSAANTAVVSCTSGERVWVQCIDPHNNECQMKEGNYNTFSGVLLVRS